MTQICLIVNSMPRDLTEFAFFLAVGFTAGSMGLIWLIKITQTINNTYIVISHITQTTKLKELIQQENQILISHLVQLIQQQLVNQKFSYHFY